MLTFIRGRTDRRRRRGKKRKKKKKKKENKKERKQHSGCGLEFTGGRRGSIALSTLLTNAAVI